LLSHLLPAVSRPRSRQLAGKHMSHSFAGPNSDDRKASLRTLRPDRLTFAPPTVPHPHDPWSAIATALRVATGSTSRRPATSRRVIAMQSGPGASRRRAHGSESQRHDHANRSLFPALPNKSASALASFGPARRGTAARWGARRTSHLGRDRRWSRGWSQFLGSLAAFGKLSKAAGSIAAERDRRASTHGHKHPRSAFEMMPRSIARISHSLLRDLTNRTNPGTTRRLLPIAPSAASTTRLPWQSAKERIPANTRAEAIVVNYSPTLVVHGSLDVPELERRLLDAIGRHGHELANIIDREHAKRSRTEL
jgi:hypothetical protein